jgi:tRNA 2-thiouridine synthesizing protein D
MRFALQVNSSPWHNAASLSAYRFAEAALQEGHVVSRVFFYHEGIYQAFKTISPPDDALNLPLLWGNLAAKHSVDLLVCISAAHRRGLLHGDEAKRLGYSDPIVADGFRIGGLGQWLEALIEADRVIVFG